MYNGSHRPPRVRETRVFVGNAMYRYLRINNMICALIRRTIIMLYVIFGGIRVYHALAGT